MPSDMSWEKKKREKNSSLIRNRVEGGKTFGQKDKWKRDKEMAFLVNALLYASVNRIESSVILSGMREEDEFLILLGFHPFHSSWLQPWMDSMHWKIIETSRGFRSMKKTQDEFKQGSNSLTFPPMTLSFPSCFLFFVTPVGLSNSLSLPVSLSHLQPKNLSKIEREVWSISSALLVSLSLSLIQFQMLFLLSF